MDPTTQKFKYDYLSCGIDKKPKWALVTASPGKAGVHSYYVIREHAELVQTVIPASSVARVTYSERGEPIIAMPAKRIINEFNKDEEQMGEDLGKPDPFDQH